MIKEFRLPDLGEGLTESEIVAWKVAVGDTVALNQIIAEVETAKAVVELPSPFAGVVAALHEQPGTVVRSGKPIVSFEIEGDDGAAGSGGGAGADGGRRRQARAEPRRATAPSWKPPAGPARRARTFAATAAAPPAVAAEPVAPACRASRRAAASAPVETTPAASAPGERPRSTPPVRKLAKDLGVDLEAVHRYRGARAHHPRRCAELRRRRGPARGRPGTRRRAGAGRRAVQAPGERETRTPIKGVRKHTAAAMVASAFTAPHVTEFLTVDVTPTMELLARLKASRAFAGYRLTPLTLVAKAVLIALAQRTRRSTPAGTRPARRSSSSTT